MKCVIQKFDVVRPVILGIFIESMHIALKSAVSEKAERAGHLDGIVKTPQLDVRLSYNRYARHFAPAEFSFHGGQCHGLVAADHFRLLVAGRKGHQAAMQSDRRACPPADRVAPAADERRAKYKKRPRAATTKAPVTTAAAWLWQNWTMAQWFNK